MTCVTAARGHELQFMVGFVALGEEKTFGPIFELDAEAVEGHGQHVISADGHDEFHHLVRVEFFGQGGPGWVIDECGFVELIGGADKGGVETFPAGCVGALLESFDVCLGEAVFEGDTGVGGPFVFGAGEPGDSADENLAFARGERRFPLDEAAEVETGRKHFGMLGHGLVDVGDTPPGFLDGLEQSALFLGPMRLV